MKNLFNLQQKHNETLIDYMAWFKSAQDIAVAQIGGPIVMTKYIKSMPVYTTTKHDKFSEQAFKELVAYLYLTNSDKTKYGSLVNGLSLQFSLEQNQYPKDVLDATNILSNHQFDAAYSENKKKKKEQQNQLGDGKKENRARARTVAWHFI